MTTAQETNKENCSETEQLHGSTNANQTDNYQFSGDQKFEGRKWIDNSPFVMVHQDEKYFVVLGKYKITAEDKDSEEEALSEIQNITWDTLIRVIDTMMDIRKDIDNQVTKIFNEE